MARGHEVGSPVRQPQPGIEASRLHQRLAAVGMSDQAASMLLAEHPRARIADALDALDTLESGVVRNPVGWMVAAVRESWDLSDLLAARREQQARMVRWEREAAERDQAEVAWRSREATASGWGAAVSADLDDDLLVQAVGQVTTPVAGLGRRSVPIARAQLLAWAVDVHRRTPDQPLDRALTADLRRGAGVTEPVAGDLPPPPGHCAGDDDLSQRLKDLLTRRPDRVHPQTTREPGSRHLEQGVDLGR